MRWWRRLRRPQPSRTGAFVENIHWWFWDDAVAPGLLTSDSFSRLLSTALTDSEYGKVCTALVMSKIVTGGKPSRSLESPVVKALLKKASDHLANVRDKDPGNLDEWMQSNWSRENNSQPMLDVVKAHINVLAFWGYPYDWSQIADARCAQTAMLFHSAGTPTHYMREEDVREVNGRPMEFSIWINGIGKVPNRTGGGNWHFHYEDAQFNTTFVVHEK